MRYTHFEIKNFKGIRSLRLDLIANPQGRIHTLVGLNESGKTTILEAIDYFVPSDETLDPKNLLGRIRPDQHDLIPIANRANFNGETTITAGFELDSSDIAALKKYMRSKHDYTLRELSDRITISDMYSFKSSKFVERQWLCGGLTGTGKTATERKYWSFGFSGRHNKYWQLAASFLRERVAPIWYFPNFLFDFPERIYLSEQENEPPASGFYRALIQDILNSVDPDATIQEHILDRVETGSKPDTVALDQLMLELGRTVTKDVFTAWDQLFDRQVGKQVDLRMQTDENGENYVEFRIIDADGYFIVKERSLGFRWFFVFLLLTKYRGFRKDSTTDMIFLFDEPASNLHSTAQSQLLESLERLTKSCSIIYTTHSQYLIDPKWLENTHVVRNSGIEIDTDNVDYNARKTNIQIDRYRTFASQHPKQSHYFQPILDVLKYFQSVILKRTDDAHFLPGGGAGSLDESIRLYLGWSRNFVVLLDSDAEGAKQKKRYLDMFGSLLDDRIFILDEIDSTLSGVAIEGVFEESDRLAIQNTAYPAEAYKKSHFWRALQEAVAADRTIELTDGTRNRFTKLLDNLGAKLKNAGPKT